MCLDDPFLSNNLNKPATVIDRRSDCVAGERHLTLYTQTIADPLALIQTINHVSLSLPRDDYKHGMLRSQSYFNIRMGKIRDLINELLQYTIVHEVNRKLLIRREIAYYIRLIPRKNADGVAILITERCRKIRLFLIPHKSGSEIVPPSVECTINKTINE